MGRNNMKIVEKIFKDPYYITSGWGPRTYWLNGQEVSDFHNGIDYGTNNKKVPQYAVEDGYIISCGIDAAGGNAKFVWVAYPRIGKKFLHYHLDSISVKAGQKVKEGTKLGTTGMTGWATGIHLHLGMKDINGGEYQNVEEYNYVEPAEAVDPFPGVSDEELAKRVWAGEFGNGDERKEKLGIRYDAVQALVDKGVGKPEAPKPKPAEVTLNKGDKVVIVGTGNGSSNGNSNVAYGLGWTREIMNIWSGRPYPYQVGLNGVTTGFYKASALKKV